MDMLVGLPEPDDLAREATPLTMVSLKEEIQRLKDKYGQAGTAILTEVEALVTKYEESWTSEARSSNGVNAALAVRDYLARRSRTVFASFQFGNVGFTHFC